MNDSEFKKLTKQVYDKVVAAFDKIDPDEAEANYSLDNVTITFGDRTIFVINRQPPVHQLWLATKNKGYHFSYIDSRKQWVASKTGEEFYHVLKNSSKPYLSQELDL